MIKPNSTWFDRLSLYRYVAILLLPLFVISTYHALTETYPFSWQVVVFWVANVLIWTAVGRDTWEVFKVKREIHQAIRDAGRDRKGKKGKTR